MLTMHYEKNVKMNTKLLIPAALLALGFSACNPDEGGDDPVADEKKVNHVPEFYPEAPESEYGSAKPELTLIAEGTEGLNSPVDLDFHSLEDRKNELWVLNPGLESQGGSTVIFENPNESPDNSEYLKDGNSWHFMALATSIAFGENGNFGTSQGILDANRRGGLFTGPTLWPSDLNIYAKVGNPPVQGTNGSHLDMIHQSPLGMGIAYEVGNTYWVFDGYNKSLCRYDFGEPHYPGGHDHSDGRVWRYNVNIAQTYPSPAHMKLDDEGKWLYVCDPGNNRVARLDVTSGTEKTGNPSVPLLYNEPLAYYGEMENFTFETFIESGLSTPAGLEIHDGRLFIGDYATGNIHAYSLETGEELGVLETGAEKLTGICVGPEGKIWYLDAGQNALFRVDVAPEPNS